MTEDKRKLVKELNDLSFKTADYDIKVSEESASHLRDNVMHVLKHTHIDLAPEYIYAAKDEKDAEKLALDGIVRTTVGYFRLAEYPETKNKILLFSPRIKPLAGQWDENKLLRISKNPRTEKTRDDVYIVSARDTKTDGSVFREDMMDYKRRLKSINLFELNLTTTDLTPKKEEGSDKTPLKIFKLANNRAAIGIFQTEDKKWIIRLYSNIRKGWDETGVFVEIDEKIPTGFAATHSFSLSEEYNKEFKNFGEALLAAKKYWSDSSMRLWKGKPLISDIEYKKGSFKYYLQKTKKAFISFLDHKHYRAATVTILFGGLSAALFGAAGLAGIGIAALGAIGMKANDDIWTHIINKSSHKADAERINKQKAYMEQDLSGIYKSLDPKNEERICKKIEYDFLPKLRLLNQLESDINYDGGVRTPTSRRNWELRSLITIPHRIFGNVTANLNENTAITQYPNGILSIMNANPETGETRTFIKYREDYKVSENAPIPQEVQSLLEDGRVIEILHKPNSDDGNEITMKQLTKSMLQTRLNKIFADKDEAGRKKVVENLSKTFKAPSRKKLDNKNSCTFAPKGS